MGSSDDSKVETAALVISLVALIGTFMQVLQQYFASATGYANCQKSLSGGWLHTLARKFRAKELRFEVLYKAPVIFVCKPDNKHGPIPAEPIRFLTGSDCSKWSAWIWTQKEQDAPEAKEEKGKILNTWKTRFMEKVRQFLGNKGQKEENKQPEQHNNRVSTADNEEATWLKLLRQLNDMEKTSAEWVDQYHKQADWVKEQDGKNSGQVSQVQEYDEDVDPNPAISLPPARHTLVVALQPKLHSWDNMPASVTKPFATTTMCHLVEIAAMLGIHWKEFDRSRDKYRAEGNGYMLTGSTNPDLGLCFTFQTYGKGRFRENRTIPVDGIKSLSFGYVPTIFQEEEDTRRLDAKDPDELQLGSLPEIAETMVQLGCNTSTANYLKTTDAVHQHLFAVPFEIIGMLGKSLHMRNSYYRMLPNPTPYNWDRDFFDLPKLIREFEAGVDSRKYMESSEQTRALKTLAGKVVRQLDRNDKDVEERKLRRENAIHEAKMKKLAEAQRQRPQDPEEKARVEDEVQEAKARGQATFPLAGLSPGRLLTWAKTREGENKEGKKPPPQENPPVVSGYYLPLLNQLHDAIDECDRYLKECPRGLVNMVVREHLQEVVKMINEPMAKQADDKDAEAAARVGMTEDQKDKKKKPTALTFFEKLSEANPEDRQREFMGTYFQDVLKKIGGRAVSSFKRLNKAYVPGQNTPTPAITPTVTFRSADMERQRTLSFSPNTTQPGMPTQEDVEAIWCTLIFRMFCWLQLHDFDKKDKQSGKSELRGSRLPVFIF
ncbi:hypothetical protein B0T20DRAFT_138441 [Sordaria brevicollis]|uniref:Modin n=1 Tax=Sordaria brevicollis TaxID=83679 RepID=A0AAE0PM34_SORBR|nr:hypothetical protein B0T20DRAFT_138441 [Sordaria brevicollis]